MEDPNDPDNNNNNNNNNSNNNNNYNEIYMSIPLLSDIVIQGTNNSDEPIREGHFERVYEGRWGKIKVALKRYRDPTETRQFQREAFALWSLRHPNIISFFGIYRDPENINYLVLEYMDDNLERFLQIRKKNGAQPRTDNSLLFDIAVQIASGVRYLNQRGFCHRDLRASNILIQRREGDESNNNNNMNICVKIGGFDLCNYQGDDQYINKYEPALPFSRLDTDDNTELTDIWFYGILLWEIWSYASLDMFHYVTQDGYNLVQLSDTPNRIYNLMKVCWERDPRARCRWARIFQDYLDVLDRNFRGNNNNNNIINRGDTSSSSSSSSDTPFP